jgi:hypothetical protein
MKRGPPPFKGFDIAIPIAMRRGRVMLFQQLPDYVCDFTIAGNGILAQVRLMTMTRVHASLAEISREYSDAVTGLCTLAFGGPVSRELWLYSRYGSLRFFRVTEVGLIEIDANGYPFVNGKPVTVLPAIPGAGPHPSNQTISGPVVPGSCGPTPPALAGSGLPGYGSCDPKRPIGRGPRKKIAGKKPKLKENDLIGRTNPVMNSNPTTKKPALADMQVPPIGPGAPAGNTGVASPAGSPDNAPSAGELDPLPEPGKSVEAR